MKWSFEEIVFHQTENLAFIITGVRSDSYSISQDQWNDLLNAGYNVCKASLRVFYEDINILHTARNGFGIQPTKQVALIQSYYTGNDCIIQFAHYHTLLASDKELSTLVKAVINNEARYVSQYPYCGAFQPPPESGLAPSHNDWADGVTVNPYVPVFL